MEDFHSETKFSALERLRLAVEERFSHFVKDPLSSTGLIRNSKSSIDDEDRPIATAVILDPEHPRQQKSAM